MSYCVGFIGRVQFCHPYLHRSNNQTHYHHNWSNNQERDNPSSPLLIEQSNAPPPQLIKQSREKETTHDHHCWLLAIGLDLSLLLVSALIDLSLSLSKPISKQKNWESRKSLSLERVWSERVWEGEKGKWNLNFWFLYLKIYKFNFGDVVFVYKKVLKSWEIYYKWAFG